jgi:DNA-binding transcriptional MerR regulator
MQETPEHLAIAELAERAGVTPRTVRYYVAEGLLPPPSGSGQNRTYSSEHLVRLAAIKRLKEAYLPLEEIRKRLAGLDAAGLRQLAETSLTPPNSALDYVTSVLASLPPPVERPPSPPPLGLGQFGRSGSHSPPFLASLGSAAPPSRPPSPRPALPPFSMGATSESSARPESGQTSETSGRSSAGSDTVWHRVVLTPGVELHYQASVDVDRLDRLGQLVALARRLLGRET